MPRLPLTPDQADLSERSYRSLRQAAEADLRPLGPTEFEVRDLVPKIGVKAFETALQGRKSG